jgi:hypothetical protein
VPYIKYREHPSEQSLCLLMAYHPIQNYEIIGNMCAALIGSKIRDRLELEARSMGTGTLKDSG